MLPPVINDFEICRSRCLASPKNVTEIWDRLFDSDWRDFTYDFGVLNRTISTVYDPVYELFGHNRPPLL